MKSNQARVYYPKRVGWRWQVWFAHQDGSTDPASGGREWMATSTKFWRWRSAARIANEIWCAFNDGAFVQALYYEEMGRAALDAAEPKP